MHWSTHHSHPKPVASSSSSNHKFGLLRKLPPPLYAIKRSSSTDLQFRYKKSTNTDRSPQPELSCFCKKKKKQSSLDTDLPFSFGDNQERDLICNTLARSIYSLLFVLARTGKFAPYIVG
jgi:hypothetical protein